MRYQIIPIGTIDHGNEGRDDYFKVTTDDGSAIVYAECQEWMESKFQFDGQPGQLFCHSVVILYHPYNDDEAIVITKPRYDI